MRLANIEMVAPVLERYGFSGKWVFRGGYEGGKCYGMSEDELMRLYREADAFLNVTASQELREEHMSIPRRVYVESDPFHVQVKVLEGDVKTLNALAAHDIHFSFGENLGQPDCDLPVDLVCWHPTRQPVLMDLWENPFPPRERFGVYDHYDLEKQGQGPDFPRRDILLDKGPGVFKDHRSAKAQARRF